MDDKPKFDAAGFSEKLNEKGARASERLKAHFPEAWYFPVMGIWTELQEYQFSERIRFQRVFDQPGEIELSGALKEANAFGVVGWYSSRLQYEFVVESEGRDTQLCLTLGWLISSAFRVKTLAEVLVPFASNHSWSTISAIQDNSCELIPLENYTRSRPVADQRYVDRSMFDWVAEHFESFANIDKEKKVRMAIEALTTYHHHTSFRVMTALLWAGIESLFQINAELRFRLATLIALTLEPRGEACLELYHRVKKLYDVRSKAVHGSGVDDDALRTHILEVRELLSRLLCRFTEKKVVPNEEDLDRCIFF
jgi:hypothetical protein